VEESDIVFDSGGLRLAGTLTLGESPRHSACVLMIPGSGPVDRNENHRRLRINVFGELARSLAERGFDSVRYDKRGVGASQGDFWSAGLNDNASDVSSAIDFLRASEVVGRDKIFLLGHSEGAYLATMVAARTSGLAGVVLLAGGARAGEEELRWQGEQVARSLTGLNAFLIKLLRVDVVRAQAKQIERIKRSRRDAYRVQLVAKVNAKWMREFLAYDPGADLARIDAPILAVTGAKDIQVDPGNLEKMATLAKASFESHLVPDVTHILRPEPGPPRLSTYKKQVRKPVDQRVVDLILSWLERQAVSRGV
jgi:pimeloyl-ACP methyl ester carboxylesterase